MLRARHLRAIAKTAADLGKPELGELVDQLQEGSRGPILG